MSDPHGKSDRSYEIDHNLINTFAGDMFKKMRQNKHKAHWATVGQMWLLGRLKEEVAELEDALLSGGDVVGESADVANFAAMIADNHLKR